MFPTAITVGPPSSSSYLSLTPFESVFILMVIIQVSVLQTTGIVPLNLNNLFTGDPSGRRRKRKRRSSNSVHSLDIENLKNDPSIKLMKDLIKSLGILDKFGCVEKTFCVLLEMDLEDLLRDRELQNGPGALFLDSSQLYQYQDEHTTTTEETPHRVPNHLILFKPLLEVLRERGPSSGSNSSAAELGLDLDYEYETWDDEGSTVGESIIPSSTHAYSRENSRENTHVVYNSSYSGSKHGRPRARVAQSYHQHDQEYHQCDDQLHNSCPITGQDIRAYTHDLFILANVF